MLDLLSPDYVQFVADLKTRIRTAQVKASLSVNREMIALYFDVGRLLVEKQENAGWGDAVVAQIARDLKRELPDVKGFSRSKLFEMRQFYLAYREETPIVPQAVGQIPWGHNWCCCTNSKTRNSVFGMPRKPSNTVGRARF